MRLGANVAVFILFFGLAFIEALLTGNLLIARVFLILGLLSLCIDSLGDEKEGGKIK